jgi:type III pantothenate kinase
VYVPAGLLGSSYHLKKELSVSLCVFRAPYGTTIQYPKYNRLVIDAGTCVTYDFIDENDNYIGGAIAPGLRFAL